MTVLYRIGRKSILLLLAALFLLAGVFAAAAHAQTGTGSLRGQVVDPSGAVVANATVVIPAAQSIRPAGTTTPRPRPRSIRLPSCTPICANSASG